MGRGVGACEGVRMRLESEAQSPEDRAERYLGKAEEIRRVMKSIRDPQVQASLKQLVADWEYLARFTFNLRR